jgi:hypothetical protein
MMAVLVGVVGCVCVRVDSAGVFGKENKVFGVGIWIVVLLWVRRGRRRDLKGHSPMCMHD